MIGARTRDWAAVACPTRCEPGGPRVIRRTLPGPAARRLRREVLCRKAIRRSRSVRNRRRGGGPLIRGERDPVVEHSDGATSLPTVRLSLMTLPTTSLRGLGPIGHQILTRRRHRRTVPRNNPCGTTLSPQQPECHRRHQMAPAGARYVVILRRPYKPSKVRVCDRFLTLVSDKMTTSVCGNQTYGWRQLYAVRAPRRRPGNRG
ncbi:hypothetical protein M2432_005564 [Mycobacterium sp. OTB74]|jgi:hypothetical protein|nr:hypothetical protein [Mycobacterium sp. OTB74]